MLESLTTAPITELGGVKFTFDRDRRFLPIAHLVERARWTGQLFQPKQKDDGVDAVAVCVTGETVTVFLIQVWT